MRLPRGSGRRPSPNDRIKFIRIGSLMVGRSPFRFWSVVTNVFWSQLSRFEDMAEEAMESSGTVDTIVLRPGDLTDEERNVNHTSLQLRVDGRVDFPSLVGREDVADLVVVSALTRTCWNETTTIPTGGMGMGRTNNRSSSAPAHHYAWAMRWTGQHLSPPQGLRPDGLGDAALCFLRAVNEQAKLDGKTRSRESRLKTYLGGRELMGFRKWRRRRLRPFVKSFAVSVPVYATLGALGWYLFGTTLAELYSRLRRLALPQILLELLPSR